MPEPKQETNVVELVSANTLPLQHKLAIYLVSNLAAFAATMLVERGYMGGLAAWRTYKANSAE